MPSWLTADPGETTGWALWEGDDLLEAGQDPLWAFIDDVAYGVLDGKGRYALVDRLVVEDWRLYPWELQSLAWDACRTARGIGALELLARRAHIPIILQPAAIKERAQAAGAEALYLTPLHENRHANDAIQHGVYYLALNHGAV